MLAYFDSITAGLVKVRIVAASCDEFQLVVTASRGCWKRGERITASAWSTVPRSAVFRVRGGGVPRIRNYSWARILFGGDTGRVMVRVNDHPYARHEVAFVAVRNLMNLGLAARIFAKLSLRLDTDAERQVFVDEYSAAHALVFGKPFICN